MKKELSFKSPQLKTILQILVAYGAKSRLIGGCVRDALLDIVTDDIDIATTLLPDEVMRALGGQNIRVLPTGIKYGTVTAILQDQKFEITTLRKDISCDGRRASVEYTSDFSQDALRRDFTINALSYCPTEQRVFDYFGGLEHLRQRRVIFIQDPAQRIGEDYLRILRFFRFSACYADDFDEKGLRACQDNAHFLSNLAQERINMELDKILLKSQDLIKVLRVMNAGVLKFIFPSCAQAISKLQEALQLGNQISISISLETIYAILLSSNESVDLSRFKFSNLRKRQLGQMLSFISSCSGDIEICLKKIWLAGQKVSQFVLLAVVFASLSKDRAGGLLRFFNDTALPRFPLSSNELMNLGYVGKDIGSMLNYLHDIWILRDFKITSRELIECLKRKN